MVTPYATAFGCAFAHARTLSYEKGVRPLNGSRSSARKYASASSSRWRTCSKKPPVMMPAGSAITAMPNSDEAMEMNFPRSVTGYTSPYPTVVSAVVAQYSASKKLSNVLGSFTNMTSPLTKMYMSATASTDSSVLRCARNTFATMVRFFE